MNVIEKNSPLPENQPKKGANSYNNSETEPSDNNKIVFQKEDSKGKVTIFESVDKIKAFLQITCSSL